MGLENVPRCQHVKMNGTQCGSPALRRRRNCFFHDRIRREQVENRKSLVRFDLPLLEDANAVQVALMQVIQRLGSGTIDHKTAGLILYALQTASSNLRHADFEVDDVSEIVIDRDTVNATSINGPQWFEEDFDDEDDDVEEDKAEEDEGGDDDEKADDENSLATTLVEPEPSAKKPARATPITPEQARMQVQTVVQNWLSKKGGQNPTVKPG